jgi:hypothetical protein
MLINYLGFLLAAWSVIGNDVIQTLGTFLQSNKKQDWKTLFLYIGGILTIVLFAGWYLNSGDVTYGRLDSISRDLHLTYWHLIPPALLLVITRYGIPVSTTFLILSIFSSEVLIQKMLLKSFCGYLIAFATAYAVYGIFLYYFEKKKTRKAMSEKSIRNWTILQWFSTAFLWVQWLIQDFANIYVFLPRDMSFTTLLVSLALLLIVLAYILKNKGGRIQNVVSSKTNSSDIRSATMIDFIYGSVLYVFTVVNTVPMSTTWAFIGILAGREIAIRHRKKDGEMKAGVQLVLIDFGKVLVGIIVSICSILLLSKLSLI